MYFIVGGSGYLGRYFIKYILDYTSEEIIATYSSTIPKFSHPRLRWEKLDVRDDDGLNRLDSLLKPETKAVWLAAYHHPDKVEENFSLAWEINIVSLAKAMNRLTRLSCLYYASTDSVYGEGSRDTKFTEDANYAPVNRYGVQKALAEQIVLSAGYNVIRYPFIIGPSLVEGRPHFYDNILQLLRRGEHIEMFSDSYRSTLSFQQCVYYLMLVIEKFGPCSEPILNISGDQALSKFDVAQLMAKANNLNSSLIKPISVHSNRGNGIFKTKRASTCILDNSRLKSLLGISHITYEVIPC